MMNWLGTPELEKQHRVGASYSPHPSEEKHSGPKFPHPQYNNRKPTRQAHYTSESKGTPTNTRHVERKLVNETDQTLCDSRQPVNVVFFLGLTLLSYVRHHLSRYTSGDMLPQNLISLGIQFVPQDLRLFSPKDSKYNVEKHMHG